MKNWTEDEILTLKQDLQAGLSYDTVSKKLNRTIASCRHKAPRLGLRNKYHIRKYSVDENFWKVPNIINSYWAGVSSADACIVTRSSNRMYVLGLQASDGHHLDKLIDSSKFTGPKRFQQHKIGQGIFSISVSCDQWGEDLKNNFNVIPKKTYRLEPPSNLSKELMYCWLIGMTDGDGNIHYHKGKNQITLYFVSASESIIKFIHSFISINFPQYLRKMENKYRKRKNQNCYECFFSGIKACIIIDYLRSFPVPKLTRKWENPIILDYIAQKKQQYPHLFIPSHPNIV